MDTRPRNLEIIDSHAHFMTRAFFEERFLKQGILEKMERRWKSLNRPAWEIPEKEETHQDLANKWLVEMDKYNISKMAFFSMDGNVAEFGNAMKSSERFIGYLYVNPHKDDIKKEIKDAVEKNGVRGLKLNPVLHYYHAFNEELMHPIYELAQTYKLPLVFHFGLSIGTDADARYMNPSDISCCARDFPEVNFILAHFGTGFFREALFTLYHATNIFLDTSSSNAWVKYLPYEIDLKGVFKKALEVGGPERLIFGTDSSFFPRGFRNDILQKQLRILTDLKVPLDDMQQIFAGNIRRLLGLL